MSEILVQDIVFAVLFSVVLVFNITGNSLVIYIITSERGMKTSTNYLLLNLAIADLLFGVFLVSRFIFVPFFRHSMPGGVLGDWMCKLLTRSNISWMASFVSLFTMLTLCFERNFAVCRPHTFRERFSARNVKILILSSWICAIAAYLPVFVFTSFDSDTLQCGLLNKTFMNVNAIFGIAELLFALTFMIYLFVKISVSLWCKQTIEPTGQREITERKKKKKVTLCVLAVIITFVLCWTPTHTVYLMLVYSHGLYINKLSLQITVLLMSVNAALDPYLYSFQSSRFTILLKNIVCCKNNS